MGEGQLGGLEGHHLERPIPFSLTIRVSGKFLQLSGKFLQLSGKYLQLSEKFLQLSGKKLQSSLDWCNYFPDSCKTFPDNCKKFPDSCKNFPDNSVVKRSLTEKTEIFYLTFDSYSILNSTLYNEINSIYKGHDGLRALHFPVYTGLDDNILNDYGPRSSATMVIVNLETIEVRGVPYYKTESLWKRFITWMEMHENPIINYCSVIGYTP